MQGCPLGINIPGFIRHIRENEPSQALARIKEANMLAAVCGRLCPAPCEQACVFYEDGAPIGIRALERYAADYGQFRPSKLAKSSGKKVAIIGSGPCGLTAAIRLTQLGYAVTIFEGLTEPGGILRYGVPDFRLPQKVLNEELNAVQAMGVTIESNVFIGQTIGLKDLFKFGFEAIFLALGAGAPKFLEIPGTNLGGVSYADEFLMRFNLFKADLNKVGQSLHVGYQVVVIGSGHAALDCARSLLRLGRDVTLILRRTEDDMHTLPRERDYAKEEGLKIEPMTKPLKILGNENNFVNGVQCIRMDFADSAGEGKWELTPVPGSEFTIEADSVIIAIGHQPNSQIIKRTPDLKVLADGTIAVNEDGMTSIAGVFSGGNIISGADSIVRAMADGKKIALAIDSYLKGRV